MKTINQSAKKTSSGSSKIVFFIILITIAIFTYVLTKKAPEKKDTSGFSALYSGESKTPNGANLPEKLKWSDSFKGINNMGNK